MMLCELTNKTNYCSSHTKRNVDDITKTVYR